jgi:hypothetical protein
MQLYCWLGIMKDIQLREAQLDLFVIDNQEENFPYWRQQLRGWVKDVFEYRHYSAFSPWANRERSIQALGSF